MHLEKLILRNMLWEMLHYIRLHNIKTDKRLTSSQDILISIDGAYYFVHVKIPPKNLKYGLLYY